MLCLHKCRFHWPSHSETTQQVVGIVQSATTTTMRLGRLKEIDMRLINFRHCWVEGSSPLVQHSLPAISGNQTGTSLPVLANVQGRNQKIQSFFLFFPSFFFLNFLVIVSLELREDQLQQMRDSSPDTYLSRKNFQHFRRPKTSNLGTSFG